MDKATLKSQWKSVRQKWTKEEIKEKIMSDDRWLIRGLMAIYKFQTAEEQTYEETCEDNGVGFSGYDGEFLTKIAKFYESKKYLTKNQIKAVRFRKSGKPKMACYAGQLAKIANGQI